MTEDHLTTVEIDEPGIPDLLDIHENIDLPLRRAMGVVVLISMSPDSDESVTIAADGAGDWLTQAKKAVDQLHKWAVVHNRGDC